VPHVRLHEDQEEKAETTQSTGHAVPLHSWNSDVAGHALPPAAAAWMTLRVRWRSPAPQVVEQSDHTVNGPTSQSVGQANELQPRLASSGGQALPPNAGGFLTTRTRVLSPSTPQVFEQLDQSPKLETAQSTGQSCALHFTVSEAWGQGFPPFVGSCRTARVRVWYPVPHELEQPFQAENAETAQSRGQAWALQALDSARYGHTYPPCRALATTERVRFCVPAAHDSEHAVHCSNEVTWQWTGHGPWEQSRASVWTGQNLPPYFAYRITVRARVCSPVPHDFEQWPHSENGEVRQSMGQGWALQSRDWTSAGHGLPP
jgi:hypothetical protein